MRLHRALLTAGAVVVIAAGGLVVLDERNYDDQQVALGNSVAGTTAVATAADPVTVAPLTTSTRSTTSESTPEQLSVLPSAGAPLAPSRTSTSSNSPTVSASSSSTVATTSSTGPTEPVSTQDDQTVALLASRSVLAAARAGVSEQVVVLDREFGQTIASAGSGGTVPAMSLVKLFIATDVLTTAGGPDDLDPVTAKNLWTMISESDDEAAQDFYDTLGGDAIIERTVKRYGLADSTPTPSPGYWGDVQVTAADVASLLRQALQSPVTGPWLESAMLASTDEGWDGFDQDFGMNAITGAGAKQGWGCCLSGVLAIHSAGFTANRIVVVLSTSAPDASSRELGTADGLMADAGVRTAIREVSATAAALAA
ncbi:hypothetical protein GIS00_19290 [Nakamurella sp. YIM 132087]|uniref:Serine hydrolase n=1 Tax=Nakamurella alba TaxID=2665158 RepID=A0A7K1FPL9_9ACTN|nr:hypothetical protein [Nakamurella alba]MTD16086.1 hypothetical protein [Nakamurella alba]